MGDVTPDIERELEAMREQTVRVAVDSAIAVNVGLTLNDVLRWLHRIHAR